MMAFMHQLWTRYRELAFYCIIGCTGATLDFLIYLVLTSKVGIHYQWANFISVSFGIVNNFFLNSFFNFRVRDRMLLRMASFYAVGMIGCAMSAGCLWLFIERIGISPVISKLGTIALVTLVQFSLNKLLTFKKGVHS